MKFEVTKTSLASHRNPLPDVLKEEDSYMIDDGRMSVRVWTCEINTLEELMDFVRNSADQEMVIIKPGYDNWELEVYDTWRE